MTKYTSHCALPSSNGSCIYWMTFIHLSMQHGIKQAGKGHTGEGGQGQKAIRGSQASASSPFILLPLIHLIPSSVWLFGCHQLLNTPKKCVIIAPCSLPSCSRTKLIFQPCYIVLFKKQPCLPPAVLFSTPAVFRFNAISTWLPLKAASTRAQSNCLLPPMIGSKHLHLSIRSLTRSSNTLTSCNSWLTLLNCSSPKA